MSVPEVPEGTKMPLLKPNVHSYATDIHTVCTLHTPLLTFRITAVIGAKILWFLWFFICNSCIAL